MKNKTLSFMERLQDYIATYLPDVKNLSKATIKSYKAVFRLLLRFLEDKKNVKPDKITFNLMTTELILEFLSWLETERKCSILTRNHHLSALASFANYAQSRDLDAAAVFKPAVERIPLKKAQGKIRSFFTREEVKILLALPSERNETGIRDKTMLCFMYATGMRAQEVCDLKVGDITFEPKQASINVIGKGRKVRRIGIAKPPADMLKTYLEHRGISDMPERHVFSSQTHEHMKVSCIEAIYEKYVVRAKKEHPTMFLSEAYTPHSMRHTTATHLIESGVSIIEVKNFLGHSSLQTTEIYLGITQDTMDQKLKAWNDKWFAHADDPALTLSTKAPDGIPQFLK